MKKTIGVFLLVFLLGTGVCFAEFETPILLEHGKFNPRLGS